ncbi:MAG: exodeoxyribonuclease VII large subunit [Bacteroidales bacterium]|nr:exodeoxyribonuclease VII large subunit [Bacteroidales bacterium]
MTPKSLTLYELNSVVRQRLKSSLDDAYWIQAELSEVHENYSGHCYVEFVQKDEVGGKMIAKARGSIWASTYKMLKPYFERETGCTFCAGIKVLVEVEVDFHELYGYSLVVRDIDPTYTIGDLAHKRQEILRRLTEEGVIGLNKELSMPRLPLRVAVVSSATAAGYGDFCHQLEHNQYGFRFRTQLFPAIMQGTQVEESIIAALDAIFAQQTRWDVVVIIRGGGATSDLSGFDSYNLATNVAQFPLPIITGIGHERDDTVIDFVAHTRVKTPTAAAELMVAMMAHEALAVNDLSGRIRQAISNRIRREHIKVENYMSRIPLLSKMLLQRQHHQLELLTERIRMANPELLLQRGYSITRHDGRVVKDASELKPGDKLSTQFAYGQTESVIL